MEGESSPQSIDKAESESASEISQIDDSLSNVDHHPENVAPPLANNEHAKDCKVSDKEITGIIEVIAATGKFWHDWDTLKSLLSCRLKQVLAEYPESEMAASPETHQSSLSGEKYPELVKRLDEELQNFIEGPPFTLQRLCEILLNARCIYPKLSKLAQALEKNLLVTSTLSMSTDPYLGAATESQPQDAQQTGHGIRDEAAGNECNPEIPDQYDPVQNGITVGEGNRDQEMSEAEGDEDNSKTDVETESRIAETCGSSSA